jgi:hypothetical protein
MDDKKISEANKGKKRSLQVCAQMSESRKGRTHSQETKSKMSAAKKGKKPNNWKGHKIYPGCATTLALGTINHCLMKGNSNERSIVKSAGC